MEEVDITDPKFFNNKMTVKTTDMTRYAQSDAQVPLLKALSTPETLERFEMACGRVPGDLLINIYNAATNLPLIYQCVPETVINAALDAAVLKISLARSLGHGCILPFKKSYKTGNKLSSGKDEWASEYRATFLIMVRGYKEIAMRTNRYRRLNTFFVYEGEKGEHDRVSGDFEIIGTRTGDKVAEYGAYLRLTNGYQHTVCWSAEKVLEHGKKYSPTWDDKLNIFKPGSRWIDHFDEQAEKTVMKNLITHHGVISDVDRSNLERIESKSDIIDGEAESVEEPGKWLVGGQPSITLNSAPMVSEAQALAAHIEKTPLELAAEMKTSKGTILGTLGIEQLEMVVSSSSQTKEVREAATLLYHDKIEKQPETEFIP